jgi:hypothetical protein
MLIDQPVIRKAAMCLKGIDNIETRKNRVKEVFLQKIPIFRYCLLSTEALSLLLQTDASAVFDKL